MGTHKQTGNQVVVKAAPTFENFVVVGGTWKETDPLAVNTTLDGNEETYNYTGQNSGVDAECDWVVKATETPAKKLDVVLATRADWTDGKYFVVVEVSDADFGGKALKQSVKLEARDSMQEVLAPAGP